jgi:hypothetical protein
MVKNFEHSTHLMQLIGLSATSAVSVAVVAIRAVVNVSAYAPVVGIRLRLLVAVGAGEHEIVAWVRVARRANPVRSAVIGWEPGVVESRS